MGAPRPAGRPGARGSRDCVFCTVVPSLLGAPLVFQRYTFSARRGRPTTMAAQKVRETQHSRKLCATAMSARRSQVASWCFYGLDVVLTGTLLVPLLQPPEWQVAGGAVYGLAILVVFAATWAATACNPAR